jgi:phosphatidylglycerophosphatase A
METMKFSEMTTSLKIKFLFASVGGVGLLPKAPGTYGSIMAMPILFVPFEIRIVLLPFLVLLAIVLFMFVVPELNKINEHDASWIVLDEVIGMWVLYALLIVPLSLTWYIVGFVIFRFYDIQKPFPINRINNKTTVFSIVADDIVAGIFSAVTVYLFYHTSLLLPFLYFL